MSVVYVDELFILNLGIDYFLLLGTAKVCALPLRRKRYALAAALGALWCCLSLTEGFRWLNGGGMKTVLAVGLCLTAFGKERALWRSLAVFLGLSVMFGGAVWAVGLSRGLGYDGGVLMRLDMRVLLLSFALCWVSIELVFRRCVKSARREICDVCIGQNGRAVHISALRDTGNSLHDALTGKAVLVAESSALAPLFSPEEQRVLCRPAPEALPQLQGFRLIPYAALGGHGLLLCFTPEQISIGGQPREDLAVAVYPGVLDREGSYRALL